MQVIEIVVVYVMCSRIKTSLKVIKWCILLHQGNYLVKEVDSNMPTRPLIPDLNLWGMLNCGLSYKAQIIYFFNELF